MASSRRFAKPCSGCRSRRIACFPGSDALGGPCHRCETRGCKCDAPDVATGSIERDENELAEMRAQISRLDNMLQVLTGQSDSVSNAPSPSSSVNSDIVEINDLIGAMTNLCFATEGLTGPVTDQKDQELVAEASEVLRQAKQDQLNPEGFVYNPNQEPNSIEDCIANLPNWEEMEKILKFYATRWFAMNDSLFSPMWYESVKQLYATDFKSLRTPCQLAELFGVLAITKSGQAVERGVYPAASKFASTEAEHYAGYLRRALDLANFLESPSFESIRAMYLIASLHLMWATSTNHFSCGFAIIPAALAFAMQLELHQVSLGRPESACEAYERRSLITALFRSDWTYPPSYGRPSSTAPHMCPLEPPDYLEDGQLPEAVRSSPWRASRKSIQCLKARWLCASLHREMSINLFASAKTCDYSAVDEYAERLRVLEEEVIPPEWRRVENPETGRLEWLISSYDVSPEDQLARIYAIPKLCKVGMALHRPFIGLKRNDDVVDEVWHRRELIRWARMSFTILPEAQMYTKGPFVAITCTTFDTLIGLCLVVKHYPDEPMVDRYREELSFCVRHLHHPGAPPAVVKLTRLAANLLDKPKIRQEEEPKMHKRRRESTQLEKIGPQRVPSLSPDEGSSKSFDFSAPVTPSTSNESSSSASSSSGPALPHKQPLEASDFERMAPFFNARTQYQLNQASHGLDVLSTVAAVKLMAA